MRFLPGDAVGPYRVTEVLGEGATGVVYRVVNSVTGRLEAMKILADGYTHDLEQAQRFLREIQLQAKLDHPNIAQVRTAFCDGSTIVLVMELIDGEPLSSILARGRLTVDAAIRVAEQVLNALIMAHHHGVIHRDVKPGNILVDRNGVVKLTDFGLAKQYGDPGQTGQGMAVGTVFYMAPEQVRGLAAIDWRADLYAAGVVLYEMLTGRRPFDGIEQYAVMRAQIEQTQVPVTQLAPDLPKEFDALIERALQKDPAQRFQSASGFLAALQELQITPPAPPKVRWQYATYAAGLGCLLLAAFAMPPLRWELELETIPLSMPITPEPPPEAYSVPSVQASTPVALVPPAPSTPPPPAIHRPPAVSRPAATILPNNPAPSAVGRISPSERERAYEPPPRPVRASEPALPVQSALPTPPKVVPEAQPTPPAPLPAMEPQIPAEKPAHWMRRGLNRLPKLFRRRDAPTEATPPNK